MRRSFFIVGTLLTFSIATQAVAAPSPDALEVCKTMATDALHNVGLQTSSHTYLNVVFDKYCEQDGSVKSSSGSLGLSIPAVPISLSGSASDSETKTKNFCKNYSSTSASNDQAFDFKSQVVEKALGSVNECVRIATNSNNTIAYQILTPSTLAIRLVVAAGQTLDVRVSHDDKVTCDGANLKGEGAVPYDTAHTQQVPATAGSYAIKCIRTAAIEKAGSSLYSETAILIDTNQGGLNIYWPQDAILPLTTASLISEAISGLKAQVAQLQDQAKYDALPVGVIVPWFEKDKEPPVGWAKCDGSDATHCPDLKGRFALGGDLGQIGQMGGTDQMKISIPPNENFAHPDGSGWNAGGKNYVGSYVATVPKPPFYSVLYIRKMARS